MIPEGSHLCPKLEERSSPKTFKGALNSLLGGCRKNCSLCHGKGFLTALEYMGYRDALRETPGKFRKRPSKLARVLAEAGDKPIFHPAIAKVVDNYVHGLNELHQSEERERELIRSLQPLADFLTNIARGEVVHWNLNHGTNYDPSDIEFKFSPMDPLVEELKRNEEILRKNRRRMSTSQ